MCQQINNLAQTLCQALICNGQIYCSPRSKAPYSTVTDFARLRGWSTSVPFTTAV
jgi:hypothetical protein